jgi:hypothetical protein
MVWRALAVISGANLGVFFSDFATRLEREEGRFSGIGLRAERGTDGERMKGAIGEPDVDMWRGWR